ncbi:hypothetical protein BH09BAC3_BH09BAC3_09990 [soil metagenome]
MKNHKPEIAFLILVILISIAGFWELFMGANAKPIGLHYLHIITSLLWLFLILIQLINIQQKRFSFHRELGIAIFIMAPLIVATVALLSVHSANKAIITGKEDQLIVQNVMVTFELGLVILLAFVLRRNRNLHGAFLMSSALLFMIIALFFALLSFIPLFKIEGPETFYRFGTAAVTSGCIGAVIGIIFFFKSMRNGWPWLLVGSAFFLNGFINSLLHKSNGIQPLTEFVGTINKTEIFIMTFIGFFTLLSITWYAGKSKKMNIKGT